jgi:hypothetical protein
VGPLGNRPVADLPPQIAIVGKAYQKLIAINYRAAIN